MSAVKRSKISKVFFFFVLSLAVLAMVGFGLTGIFSQSITASVASVGKVDVSTDDYFRGIQNEISSVSRQVGTPISIDQALTFGLDRTVLQRLITQAAYEDEALRLEISVSDQTILDDLVVNPAFQGLGGTFDKEMYEETIRRSGLTPSAYEELLRKDSTQSIIQTAVAAGAELPEEATIAIFDYIGETRAFTYARLNESNISGSISTPTEAELKAFYDANPDMFTQPITRKITYVSLTPAMVADTLDISDERVAALYDDRGDEYNTPAKRFVERIVLGSQEEAGAARASIDAGELTFEAVVASRGLTISDVDLGDVTPRDVGSDAAEILFASEEPGIYGPVTTNLGPALFRVNAAIAELTIPLEEVAAELRNELAIEDAGSVIADIADQVIDLLAAGATLEEVADETDLQLDTIDLAEGSSDGIAAYATFREEATAAEVGEERDILDLEDGGVFSLRVDEIVESFVKPMASVTDQLFIAQRAAKTQEMIIERADQVANAISVSNGGSLADFSGSLQIETAADVSRTSTIPDLPPVLVSAVFALSVGETAVIEDVNGAVIVQLNSSIPFDPESERGIQIVDQVSAQQSALVAQDLSTYFAAALVGLAKPTVNQVRIDSLHLQLN